MYCVCILQHLALTAKVALIYVSSVGTRANEVDMSPDMVFARVSALVTSISKDQAYIYITQTLIGDEFMVSVFVTPDCWVVFMPPPGLSHICSVER